MSDYEDVFELLEAVRTYEPEGVERIRPCNSVKGTSVGYCTADSVGPAKRWTISVANLRKSCEARTSDEAKMLLTKMKSFHDRRILMEDLRSGKLTLEERPAPDTSPLEPNPEADKEIGQLLTKVQAKETLEDIPDSEDGDLEGFLDLFET